MTNPKKDDKKSSKPTIQINRRESSKKKPDLFANIRNREHPLDEIFPSPPQSEQTETKALDIQNQQNEISKTQNFGYPNSENLDIQSEKTGYPKEQDLDILISKNRGRISKSEQNLDIKISKNSNLDIQNTSKKGKFAKYDSKRQKRGVFLRTEDGITRRFKKFCIDNEWDFAYGTELAWNKLMNDLDIQTGEGLDIKISHDERRLMLTSKTKAPIINLYLAYNSILNSKTKWTIKDDDAGSRLNDVDLRIIELGILQTQAQKNFKGKVHSFNYYVHEIENFLALEIADETLDVMLKLNRATWERATGKKLDLSFLDQEKNQS